MSTQNPIIPTPLQAQGIDAVIQDLQTHLDFDLSWLTNGMGQGYRLAKVRTPQNIVFLPEVYLGTTQNKYFSATPDNDKTGQSVFIIGTETLPNYQTGFFGYLEYELSILFTANLKLIDSTLLETEDFTEHLITDVRQSIIRNLLGKSYRVTIDSIERGFENTYSDFDIANDRGISYLPLTHFRLNCTVQVKEDCPPITLNRCVAITNNLTTADLLDCVLALYDFSNVAVQNALSPTQVTDLQTAFCTPCPPIPSTCPEILAFILPVRTTCVIPSLDFSAGFDDDFNALDVTQIDDLETRICTPVPVIPYAYSMRFDGTNEYVLIPDNAGINFSNAANFSVSIRIKLVDYSIPSYKTVLSKRNVNYRGYAALFNGGNLYFSMAESLGSNFLVRTNGVTFTNNTWYTIGFTYNWNGSYTGLTIYVNGVAVPTTLEPGGTGAGTSITTTVPLYLSYDIFLNGYINGNLGVIRFWKTLLNASEMLQDYNGGEVLQDPILPLNLSFEWGAGREALYGTQWVFPIGAENPTAYSINMEFADRTNDIP